MKARIAYFPFWPSREALMKDSDTRFVATCAPVVLWACVVVCMCGAAGRRSTAPASSAAVCDAVREHICQLSECCNRRRYSLLGLSGCV